MNSFENWKFGRIFDFFCEKRAHSTPCQFSIVSKNLQFSKILSWREEQKETTVDGFSSHSGVTRSDAVLFHKLQLIIGHACESRDYSYLISLLSNTTETLEMSHYKPIINPLPPIYSRYKHIHNREKTGFTTMVQIKNLISNGTSCSNFYFSDIKRPFQA